MYIYGTIRTNQVPVVSTEDLITFLLLHTRFKTLLYYTLYLRYILNRGYTQYLSP